MLPKQALVHPVLDKYFSLRFTERHNNSTQFLQSKVLTQGNYELSHKKDYMHSLLQELLKEPNVF